MKPTSIVVLLENPAQASHVIPRVARLAKGFGARVEFLHVAYSPAVEASHLFDARAREKGQQGYLHQQRVWLEGLVAPLADEGLSVAVHVLWAKHWVDALLEFALQQQAGLVVKAVSAHNLLQRSFFAHNDWRLLRECPVPVLFTKEKDWEEHLALMVAVDPTEDEGPGETRDDRLLATTAALAASLPAELHVGHAYEPVPSGVMIEFDTLFGDYEAYREQVRRHHRGRVDRLLQRHRLEASVDHFVEGQPERVLPQLVAREGIDLLVMGALARTGIDRLVVGMTAERLLDQVACDLLIIR